MNVGTHKNMDFGTPDSSMQSGADSPLLTPRSSPRMERNDATPKFKMQPMHTPDVIDLLSPDSMTQTPRQTGTDEDEGFIKVVPRNSSQRKSIQTKLPWSTPTPKPLDRQSMPSTGEVRKKPVPLMVQPPMQKQIQIDTFSEILQDRVSEVLSRIEQSETTSLQRITAQMAILQNWEADWQEEQKRAEAGYQAHEDRMTTREKNLKTDETMLLRMHTEIQESLSLANIRFQETKHQMELSFTSWADIARQKFKDDLDGYRSAYQDRTKDFCTDQMQQLEAYLDGYHANARVIQADLLIRLRDDVATAYDEARQQHTEYVRTRAIPPDDDHIPETEPLQHSDSSKLPPQPPGTIPISKRRWAPEVYEQFGQPAEPRPPPMQQYTHSHRPQSPEERYASQHNTPSMPHHPMTATEIDLQVSRYRKASTPTHLRGRDRQSVTVFYNSFVDFSKIYRIPFKILDDVRIDKLDDVTQERLHPMDLLHNQVLYDCYSSAIYARLEEETVLDSSDKLFKGLLQMYNSKRDGYRLLQDLLAATLLVPAQNVGQLSTPPTVTQGTTPYDFACELKEFFACQEQRGRSYATREKSMMYLQGMQQETLHTQASTQLIFDLKQIPEDEVTPIPIRLAFPNNLPLTLLTTAETMNAHQHATINVTRSTTRPYDQEYAARRPDRDRSRERRPSLESGSRASQMGSRTNSRGQSSRPPSGTQTNRIPARNPDVQCMACGTSGHQVVECRILPRVQGCLEYITSKPAEAQDLMRTYRKGQHPDARRIGKRIVLYPDVGFYTCYGYQRSGMSDAGYKGHGGS